MISREYETELKRQLGIVEAAEKKVLSIRQAITDAKQEFQENKRLQHARAENHTAVLLGEAEAEDIARPERSQHDIHTVICALKKRHDEAQAHVQVVRGNYRAVTCDAIREIFDAEFIRYRELADQLSEVHQALIGLDKILPGDNIDSTFRNALEIPGTNAKGPAYVPPRQHKNFRAYLYLSKGTNLDNNFDSGALKAELREKVGHYGLEIRDPSLEFMVL